ncbi:hypothetical protein PQX77_006668 [Marasmius sp. AFHP31]|nr:hypothetical protein PQX77_006668 [Marasmius sp. AFHP31]
MSLLHVHFHLRNLQAFRRLLSGIANGDDQYQPISVSASPSRSLKSKSSHLHSERGDILDVNSRDSFGRTVLHLACSSTEASSVEYVRLLLKCPGINVNTLDGESQWTPLHRAMYVGNLGVALLLLQHPTTDPSIKDLEGFTAFDLYNSTVEGTKPESNALSSDSGGGELYSWGANRNALLAHGDSSDRAFPDQVFPPKAELTQDDINVEARFARAKLREVEMGKLHTAVISSSPSGNTTSTNILSLCGFGSGGRLGNTQHTQYTLKPVPIAATSPAPIISRNASARDRSKFSVAASENYTGGTGTGKSKVTSVALGQDHTLALTDVGEVYSWGLNRFAQLGYVVESGDNDPESTTTTSGSGEQIQLSPRRIYGALKKEFVVGIAASKGASACWVKGDASGESNLYTWGLNGGQLGYDRVGSGSQIQVLPRKVTKITKPVVQVAMTESAMACVLGGSSKGDVLIFWGDRVARINFPTHTFASSMVRYRPPQAMRSTRITKIVCSDDKPTPFSASALTTQASSSNSNLSSSSGLSSMMQVDNANSPATVNFACVSEGGEVFVFGAPGVPPIGVFGSSSSSTTDMLDVDGTSGSGGSLVMGKLFKPQRVWALKRGLIGAVKDVAIGSDGALVVCTVSGHVYVRSRSSATGSTSASAIVSVLSSGLSVSPSDQATLASLSRVSKAAGNASSGGGGKSNKFSRVPFLQRVVSVCASSTGAFGAIRVDASVPDIVHPRITGEMMDPDDDRKGWELTEDMAQIRPWMWTKPVLSPLDKERLEICEPFSFFTPDAAASQGGAEIVSPDVVDLNVVLGGETKEDKDDEDDLDEDEAVDRDIASLSQMCSLLVNLADTRRDVEGVWGDTLPYGADIVIAVRLAKTTKAKGKKTGKLTREQVEIPAHRLVLGTRSKALCSLLSSSTTIRDGDRSIHIVPSTSALAFAGFHPLTVLVLLEYLYTDNLVSTWDRRVSSVGLGLSSRRVGDKDEKYMIAIVHELNLSPTVGSQIKLELQALGRLLELPEMLQAMESVVKRQVVPTLKRDLASVYREAQDGKTNEITRPDVVLALSESKEVFLHSTILRARSEFFDAFLGEDLWTRNRWGGDRRLSVDLKHVRWGVMEYVLKWLCCGETENLFGTLGFADSVDAVLEFLFEVISVANELLLSPLILITSQMVLKFLHTSNACYILTEATHYNIQPLVASVQGYIAADLETFLENKMLEALAPSVVKQLSVYVRSKQEEKAQFIRGGGNSTGLMEKWKDWLMQEDIPTIIVPSVATQKRAREKRVSQASKLSPPSPSIMPLFSTSKAKGKDVAIVERSPLLKGHSPRQEATGGDDIFDMDGLDIGPASLSATSSALHTRSSATSVPAWKAPSVPRVDMRALLAQEASSLQAQRSPNPTHASVGQTTEESPFGSLKRPSGSSQRDVSTIFDSPLGKSSSSPRSGGSPWKATPAPPRHSLTSDSPKPPATNLPSKGGSTLAQAPVPPKDIPRRPSQQMPATPPKPSQPTQPGLGPVFTPARVTTPKSNSPSIPRRTSSNNAKAWVAAPKQQTAPVTTGMSFVAIQQLELEQGAASEKDKRSLVDIQKEEQDKRQEEEFMRWWQAEEERVRLEAEELRLGEERSRKETAKGGGRKPQRKSKGKSGQGGSGLNNNGPAQPGPSGGSASTSFKTGGPKSRKASNTAG